MDILLTLGFKFVKIATEEFFQLIYSVESAFCQNLFSACSLSNLGIFFTFLIVNHPFFFIHISCRYNSDFVVSNCKND